MSLETKIKHFLGLDFMKDYWWLKARKYQVPCVADMEVKEDAMLMQASNCNIIVAENIRLSLEANFSGIILGRNNSVVRIKHQFSGVLSCDTLILDAEVKLTGEVFINKLVMRKGKGSFDVKMRMGKLMDENAVIKLSDLYEHEPETFIKKYHLY